MMVGGDLGTRADVASSTVVIAPSEHPLAVGLENG